MKKKGSTILTILAISSVMVILIGVALGAMVFTQKGNSIEKKDDDVLYAAEAGIEQAIMNVDSVKKVQYQNLPIGGTDSFNLNSKFLSENITVDILVEKMPDGKRFKAVSKAHAIGTSNEKTVTAIIKKERSFTRGTENLLQYSLCGNNVNMFLTGPLNPSYTYVNSTGGLNIKYIGLGTPPTYTTVAENKQNFLVPDFNFPVYAVSGVPTDVVITSPAELDALSLIPNSGVVKEKYKIQTHPYIGREFPIYLVNAPNLIIKHPSTVIMNDMILLCSGNVTVITPDKVTDIDSNGQPIDPNMTMNLAPQINLNNATIIANSINLYLSNFMLTNPTYSTADSSFLHDALDVDAVNDIIGRYDSNWTGASGTPGSETWTATEVEYE